MWMVRLVAPNFSSTLVGPFILRTVQRPIQGPIQGGLNFHLDELLVELTALLELCRSTTVIEELLPFS